MYMFNGMLLRRTGATSHPSRHDATPDPGHGKYQSIWVPLLGEEALCGAASEKLWRAFVAPVVFYSLAAGDMLAASLGDSEAAGVRRMSVNNWARTWLPAGDSKRSRALMLLHLKSGRRGSQRRPGV